MAFLREDLVQPVKGGVQADIDCHVGGQALSIKTVSMNGGIRIKWTANASKAVEFMNSYRPHSDLLIIRIVWGSNGYVRYVPLDIQEETFTSLGLQRYLNYSSTTNTRGINLSGAAESAINKRSESFVIPMLWHQTGSLVGPYKKWVTYWEDD